MLEKYPIWTLTVFSFRIRSLSDGRGVPRVRVADPARNTGTVRAIMADLLVVHGPNLNLLGTREPGVYGHSSLAQVDDALRVAAKRLGVSLECFQSNAEHALVDRIQQAPAEGVRFVIINPAAFTHTSVALRDALLGVGLPFIEVHLSNVFAREDFRRHSYFSDVALGVISGFGPQGYELAVEAAVQQLNKG